MANARTTGAGGLDVDPAGRNKLSACVGTPGFSRLSFVCFADTERLGTSIEAHERFFDALDGVPHRILYDSEA